MPRIRIDFTGQGGQSKYVEFDTNRPLDDALEVIGQVMASGSLYIVKDGEDAERVVCAIPGRRIEAVDVVRH